jgi:hypothetical protein
LLDEKEGDFRLELMYMILVRKFMKISVYLENIVLFPVLRE